MKKGDIYFANGKSSRVREGRWERGNKNVQHVSCMCIKYQQGMQTLYVKTCAKSNDNNNSESGEKGFRIKGRQVAGGGRIIKMGQAVLCTFLTLQVCKFHMLKIYSNKIK